MISVGCDTVDWSNGYIYIYIYIMYIYISAVKRLIVINRIQNKRFCLHNIPVYVCAVYIHYVQVHLNKLECHGKVNLFQ